MLDKKPLWDQKRNEYHNTHKILVGFNRRSELHVYVSTTHLCSHDELYVSSVNSFNIMRHIVKMSHILILYEYMHILTIYFDQHQWPLLGTDNKLCIASFF